MVLLARFSFKERSRDFESGNRQEQSIKQLSRCVAHNPEVLSHIVEHHQLPALHKTCGSQGHRGQSSRWAEVSISKVQRQHGD